MPQIMPSKEDLDRMTPAQKARARRAIARIALELDQAAADICNTAAAQREAEQRAWGEAIRAQARHLQTLIPPEPEPVTAARRRNLLQATK